jgi:hypothetical protein
MTYLEESLAVNTSKREVNRQIFWVPGPYPSSVILENRKQYFGNWICFRPQVMEWEDT